MRNRRPDPLTCFISYICLVFVMTFVLRHIVELIAKARGWM